MQVADGRIAVPGGNVFWRRFGNGSGIPLLVIHGGPGLTSGYLESFTALSDARPVFMWDQLDCGRSDCPKNPRPMGAGAVRRRARSGPGRVDAWPGAHPRTLLGRDAGHGVARHQAADRDCQRHIRQPLSQYTALDRGHASTRGPLVARRAGRHRGSGADRELWDAWLSGRRLGRMDACAHRAAAAPGVCRIVDRFAGRTECQPRNARVHVGTVGLHRDRYAQEFRSHVRAWEPDHARPVPFRGVRRGMSGYCPRAGRPHAERRGCDHRWRRAT